MAIPLPIILSDATSDKVEPIVVPDSITNFATEKEWEITRGRFSSDKVTQLLGEIFTPQQIEDMRNKKVDQRMIFGINPHYLALAQGGGLADKEGQVILPDMPPSQALLALIMPRSDETLDLSGVKDPSNQMYYSPEALKGEILHKYDEIVLGHVAKACSAHCWYCFRLDLFNGSTDKGLVKPEALRDYVKNYNQQFERGEAIEGRPGETRYPITEILLSGGDPMVLGNKQLYKFLAAAGEAGVNMVRIGTKELAFRPERFDDNFMEMLKIFHENYPNTHINFVTHFSHPDEFLERDKDGSYIKEGQEGNRYKWLDITKKAVEKLSALHFVSLDSQAPIIDRVNDDAKALHLLHQELRRHNIRPKYTFQCREIEGHKAFAVAVEKAWQIHRESQKGLSDAARSRFAMSTEEGKLEVVSVVDIPDDAPEKVKSALGNGFVVFKVHRSPFSADTQGDIVIARRNPAALWISGYEDRIIYDGRKAGAEKLDGLAALLSSITKNESSGDLAKNILEGKTRAVEFKLAPERFIPPGVIAPSISTKDFYVKPLEVFNTLNACDRDPGIADNKIQVFRLAKPDGTASKIPVIHHEDVDLLIEILAKRKLDAPAAAKA